MEEKFLVAPKPQKSPAAAGLLSAFFPGIGAVYNGQVAKGVLFIVLFAGLITLQGRGGQPFTALMLAGFYIYQIIEAVQSARAINLKALAAGKDTAETPALTEPGETFRGSIFWGIALMALGLVLILANFDVVSYDRLIDFWPIVVIGIGLKLVAEHFRRSGEKQ